MRGRKTSWLLLVIFVLAGLFVGNRIGDALQQVVPAAARYGAIAIDPHEIKILDLLFTVGIGFKVNLAGVVGGLAGIFVARRV